MRLLLPLLLVACAPIDPVAKRMQAEAARGASVAWLVADAQTGEVLSQGSPDTRMLPASVMKLLSTFVALRVRGAEFRFVTTLSFDAPVQKKVDANLVISASGDPSFASTRFDDTRDTVDRIADAFVARGISEWRGEVLVNAETAPLYAPGATHDDLGSEYSPPATRFYFAENTRVRVIDRQTQALDDAVFVFHPAKSYDDVCRRPPQSAITVCDIYAPIDQQRFKVRYADGDPLASFARALQAALLERKVTWRKEPLPQKPAETELIRIESPSLATIVRITNKLSLNVYADALALAVAKERTFEELAAALQRELTSAGLDTRGAFLFDGSGLSRYDALSAAFVVALVRAGSTAPFGDVWTSSFAVSGTDGTLRRRSKPPLVFAKTGTLKAQRGLAGLAYRPNDARHPLVAFALFIDHHEGGPAVSNALLDDLIPLLSSGPSTP